MTKRSVDAWLFAVAIVRKADKFLLVHERSDTWYLPAGRVEPGEDFASAARRETLEEAGVPIRLTGVIRIEPSHSEHSLRMRVVYLAEPADDTPPKRVADEHSLGAAWVSLDELDALPLRGTDVRDYFEYVAAGGEVAPLDVIGVEGTELARPERRRPS